MNPAGTSCVLQFVQVTADGEEVPETFIFGRVIVPDTETPIVDDCKVKPEPPDAQALPAMSEVTAVPVVLPPKTPVLTAVTGVWAKNACPAAVPVIGPFAGPSGDPIAVP